MGRNYKCKTCGEVHSAPMGNHCDRLNQEQDVATQQQPHGAPTDDTQTKILAAMMDLQTKFSAMDENMKTMQAERAAERGILSQEDASTPPADEGATGGQPEPVDQATPESIRRDTVIMRQASRRLARLRQEEWEDDEDLELASPRLAGKKSGSIMTAADIVVKRIDWPHFYIKRIRALREKGSFSKNLRWRNLCLGSSVCWRPPTLKCSSAT